MRGGEVAQRARVNVETLLHVTNGDSTGHTLRATTLGGDVLSWHDVLHEGPVPAAPRDELLRRRAEFLSDCGWGTRSAICAVLERRDRRFLDALRDRRQVVLWFEHDLFDQLQLIDALALAGDAGARLELIVVSSFPGKPSFRGLGELIPDELETLWPERRATTQQELSAAIHAWEAFRAPEPVALAELVARTLAARPSDVLANALQRLLEELPSTAGGLSGTEHRALAAIAPGSVTASKAFAAAQDAQAAPFLGDAWFYRALSGLGRGSARLVETVDGRELAAPSPAGGPHLWRIPLRLTDMGERVLRGEVDRVELLGVDRWVGGTHVTADNAWRWDAVAPRLIAPP